MKKFFKDVIGELKNPSDDAEKVLGVVRRVIRLYLVFVIITNLVSLVIPAINLIYMNKTNPEYIEMSISSRGLLSFILSYIKVLFKLILNIILFLFCNKSIKYNCKIDNKIFIAVLIVMVLLPIIFLIIGKTDFIDIIISSIINICIAGIVFSAFYNFKYSHDSGTYNLNEENRRIRNIVLLGYLQLVAITIPIFITFAMAFQSMIAYIEQYTEVYSDSGILGLLYGYSNMLYAFMTLILLVIIVLTFILRLKYTNWLKTMRNILFVAYAIFSIPPLIIYGFNLNNLLYIIIFLITTGYQNKYKSFDNIGSRIFKKTIESIKAGFNNYLSFKE